MISGRIDLDQASHQNGATPTDCRGTPIGIRTDAGLTAITIRGEIDASVIDELGPPARGLVRECGALLVELSGIDFIAGDGLRALIALWAAESTTTETPQVRDMRICSEQFTVILRRGG